ncbi:hypothetical protein AS149_25740 [Burkholderia cenocepacia]|nr:hypothetical protein AS149_25740 [Burkholderia cenocepacia]
MTRTTRAFGANPLLLKALIALDALQQGKGTRGLFTVLGRQLVVSENLCAAGYLQDMRKTVRQAHAALVRVDWDARPNDEWRASGEDYEALRAAVLVFDEQLLLAPREEILAAELQMNHALARPRTTATQ